MGQGEGKYLLFSIPETRTVRSLMMSLVASKSQLLETVGLVEGQPGGIGRLGRRIGGWAEIDDSGEGEQGAAKGLTNSNHNSASGCATHQHHTTGSGMTVRYEPVRDSIHKNCYNSTSRALGGHLLNLLPLRRVNPRLLKQGAHGMEFIKEVAEVHY